MEAAQERQTGRGLAFQQHHDDREIRGLYPFVECLIIFEHLPIADPTLAYQ